MIIKMIPFCIRDGWEKESGNEGGGRTQPWLHMVPVNAFGEYVLIIDDDPSMREQSEVRKENQPSCTNVLPQQEWWANQFILSD